MRSLRLAIGHTADVVVCDPLRKTLVEDLGRRGPNQNLAGMQDDCGRGVVQADG